MSVTVTARNRNNDLQATLSMVLLIITFLLVICTEAKLSYYNLRPRTLNSLSNSNSRHAKPGGQSYQLLDLEDFQFILEPRRTCSDKTYFLVLVHSQPQHFKERELIRQTWGSVTKMEGWEVRTVFLLGQYTKNTVETEKSDQRVSHNSLKSRSLHQDVFFKSDPLNSELYKADSTELLVKLESDVHGDIIQGSFADTPRNLTYKHVMGYKWVDERCFSKPKFVLKSDDDVFIEMYHLFNFVSAVYGTHPGPSLVCDVIPAGTAPHRTHREEVVAAEREFFNKKMHPKYCSGAAYLITPSLVQTFLQATREVPALWVDDVYMTGMVREYLGVSPFYLNLRYTYEVGRPTKWLHSKKKKPLPFIFVVPDSSSSSTNTRQAPTMSWGDLVRSLWSKSEQIQSHQYRI